MRRQSVWRARRCVFAPDFVGAHRVLTAAAAMTEQRELAAASLKALLRVQPNLSLAGSPARCLSNANPNATIICRRFDGLGSSRENHSDAINHATVVAIARAFQAFLDEKSCRL